MSEPFQLIIGAVIRNLLVWIGGMIVTHGWMTKEQFDSFNTPQLVTGIVILIGGLAWSIYQKLRGVITVKTASKLPSGTPMSTIRETASNVPTKCALQ
jgi:hypothetical protein